MMSDKTAMQEELLTVRGLVSGFETDRGIIRAVDGVSFEIEKGKTTGVVGESAVERQLQQCPSLTFCKTFGRFDGSIVSMEKSLSALSLIRCIKLGNDVGFIFQNQWPL